MDKMEEVIETSFKAMIKILNSPELVDAIATFNWNLYNKLIEKGFSEEAALKIVVALASSPKK